MVSASLFQIARNGKMMANSIEFDHLSYKEIRNITNSIPSIKADRNWKAFVIKLKRKMRKIIKWYENRRFQHKV